MAAAWLAERGKVESGIEIRLPLCGQSSGSATASLRNTQR